MGQHSM